MKFIIVEIKDKDLYTIYDVENKGVCCCSMYTLKQLVKDYKCKIIGLRSKNGKLYCEERNFDGTVRKRKAPCICQDETKRNAKTIVRGLGEKDYPKETKGRAGVFSNIDENKPVLVEVDDKKLYGILCRTADGIVCCDSEFHVINKDKIKSIKKQNPEKEVDKQALLNVAAYMGKIYSLEKEISDMEKELVTKKAKLQQLKNGTRVVINKNKAKKYEKEVTGKEEFFQDFYKNTLDIPFLEQVIKKTDRKITYTYGLSFRNPTTNHKPISKELALEYLKHSMISVRATKDEVNINEVSETDMW